MKRWAQPFYSCVATCFCPLWVNATDNDTVVRRLPQQYHNYEQIVGICRQLKGLLPGNQLFFLALARRDIFFSILLRLSSFERFLKWPISTRNIINNGIAIPTMAYYESRPVFVSCCCLPWMSLAMSFAIHHNDNGNFRPIDNFCQQQRYCRLPATVPLCILLLIEIIVVSLIFRAERRGKSPSTAMYISYQRNRE